MTKSEEEAKEILYGIGCLLIIGFLVIAFVYYMIVIPIVVGVVITIYIIIKIRKKKNWKPKKEYNNWYAKDAELKKEKIKINKIQSRLLVSPFEYTQMCKDLKKTTFTSEEYKKWKKEEITICPDCKNKLNHPYNECDLCGYIKPKKEYKDRPTEYYRDKPKEEYKEKRSRTIPKAVQREVWRRDEGKCIECGTKELLEYDHIIPFSKGGSNTVRNIQLLCENCNRKKYNKI